MYMGILLNIKRKRDSDTCYSMMNLEDTVESEISQYKKKTENKCCVIPLAMISRTVESWLPEAGERDKQGITV